MFSTPDWAVMSPLNCEVPERVTTPVPAWIKPPGFAPPTVLITPPPSIAPETVVVPAPLKVKSLMMVCSGPVIVSVLPAATFQDCGAPT